MKKMSELNLNFDPFPILETERLLLRKLTSGDIHDIYFLRSDERILKYLGRSPDSLQASAQFIQNIHENLKNSLGILWGIALKESPNIIGTICYWNIQPQHFRSEIGYALHPDHQGNGYMKEAMVKVIDFGFNTMELHSIEADVDPNNIASINLLERSHFVKEAHFRENFFYNGKFCDTAVFSLLSPGP
jgi:ribosomal-protein-alanine N-acetyltransferase